ncbi:MAG: hypothetical protein HY859_07290 [Caulobacterales bacterium]|nr:hypothetical protein [Caulobacterales bacterium]
MALAEVKRFSSLQEAQIAAGMLRSIGIDAAVCDEHYGAVMPLEQLALGGFRLTAPEGDVQEARTLLRRDARTPEPDDEPIPAASPGRMALAGVLFFVGGSVAASYLAAFRRRAGPSMSEVAVGSLLAFAILAAGFGTAAALIYALVALIVDPP